jgi:hypothetical protein
MTEEELIAWMRERGPRMIAVDAEMVSLATDRIEQLNAELAKAVEAWDAVLDRIRKLRGEGWEGAPGVHPYDKGYLAALDAMRDTIRAMKGGE